MIASLLMCLALGAGPTITAEQLERYSKACDAERQLDLKGLEQTIKVSKARLRIEKRAGNVEVADHLASEVESLEDQIDRIKSGRLITPPYLAVPTVKGEIGRIFGYVTFVIDRSSAILEIQLTPQAKGPNGRGKIIGSTKLETVLIRGYPTKGMIDRGPANTGFQAFHVTGEDYEYRAANGSFRTIPVLEAYPAFGEASEE